MPQTDMVEMMSQFDPLVNLFAMAEEILPWTTNQIADWFYGNRIGEDLTLRLLSVIVF